MTNEQKKMVENNHALIYLVIRSLGLPVEEHYDLGAIGLCNAAINYVPEKYAFTTYACRCIKNEIIHDYQSRNREKRINNEYLISYDIPVLSADDNERITLIDCIKSNESVENEAISRVMYDELVRELGVTDSSILKFFRLGLKQTEIAKITGVTQQNVSRVKRRVENILQCNY